MQITKMTENIWNETTFHNKRKNVLQKIEIRATINKKNKILIISSTYLTMEINKANVTKTK